MSNPLFKKPKNMRWVDLAIWIDENFYKEDCDYNTAYSYIYLLAMMLSSKHKYFDNQKDYEEFASILAYDTYKRMSNPNKSKVKSVLNYMKSVISFRRIGFNYQKRQKIIDPTYDQEWDAVSYVERCKDSYEASTRDRLFEGISEILHETPSYIRNSIPKVFKSDKVLFENIYISSMLSMLNRITLPTSYEDKFNLKINESSTFNEVKFYTKYLDDDILLWHLPESFENVVRVVLNKTNNIIVNEIKGITNDARVSDEEFGNIMSSGFSAGGRDETSY